MLDGYSVGVPSPDTYRSPTGIVVFRSVVVRDASLDGCAVHIAQHDTIAAVMVLIGNASIIVGVGIADVYVLVRPTFRRAGEVAEGVDARVGIIVGRNVRDPHIPEAALGTVFWVSAKEYARVAKTADLDIIYVDVLQLRCITPISIDLDPAHPAPSPVAHACDVKI